MYAQLVPILVKVCRVNNSRQWDGMRCDGTSSQLVFPFSFVPFGALRGCECARMFDVKKTLFLFFKAECPLAYSTEDEMRRCVAHMKREISAKF